METPLQDLQLIFLESSSGDSFKSAELNVYVNASALNDRKLAEKKIDEIRQLGKVVDDEENEIFSYVSDVILKKNN